jgi:small-conductance mechanosensitive channel
MQAIVLGNSVAAWITALGWALGVTGAIILMRRLVTRRLASLAAKTTTVADDALVEAVRSVRKTYVLLIALGVAANTWLDLKPGAHATFRLLVIFVAVIQAIRTGNAVIEFWVATYSARRDSLDRTTLRAISYAGRVLLYVTILLVALEATGFQVKTLLAGLGVGGIAVALAVQNILGDLFAALSIVLDKPFVVGDAIAVDQFEGDVVNIGLKSTRVRSVNGEEVVFANTDLLKSRLRNLTRRHSRRYVLTLVLAPGTPAERVQRVPVLVAESVAADGRATLQRSHVIAIGINGAEVETSLLIPGTDFLQANDIRQAVLLGILQRFEREGITLARPVQLPAGTGVTA